MKVRPSVEEVQKMLNSIGQTITSVSKGVGQWKRLERPKKASDKVIFIFFIILILYNNFRTSLSPPRRSSTTPSR